MWVDVGWCVCGWCVVGVCVVGVWLVCACIRSKKGTFIKKNINCVSLEKKKETNNYLLKQTLPSAIPPGSTKRRQTDHIVEGG